MSTGPRQLCVIACGALANELNELRTIHGFDNLHVECLPGKLHNHPEQIPTAVRDRVRRARQHYDEVLVGYADCGTGGLLDRVCADEGVERLAGAHCYEFFAGSARFAELHEDQLGTFYLTDYLANHFDRLVWRGFGLDKHPQLVEMMFGNYTRVVLLTQTDSPSVHGAATGAAKRLDLPLEILHAGYGQLETEIVHFVRGPVSLAPEAGTRAR
ncbi:MAG: DUF1638 domain-containing protein [Actinomycetia bacterium]|nr:DUF1638 domain-containing protein [Actinomycetes bacterium]MCP4961445.1 DUF1638 domain-containing protein [Actinomycetes bacterium]